MTLRLVFFAMLVAALIAIVVGVISATKQYSKTDYTFTFTGFLFLAMPTFWFAILLKEGAIWSNKHFGTKFKTIGENSPNVCAGSWARISSTTSTT